MENKYFQQALSSMAANAAYGDAIRHLYDCGLSVTQIHKSLDFPASIETIESVIQDYEMKKSSKDSDYEYIQTEDSYGRRSFIRVSKKDPSA